jgi:hypothetical protein
MTNAPYDQPTSTGRSSRSWSMMAATSSAQAFPSV